MVILVGKSDTDCQCAREESKQLKLYQRIESMKQNKLWGFKQAKPFQDPPREKSHHDNFLEEMVCYHSFKSSN